MIARERYRQARRFVEEVARPLDRALLAYHRGEAERDEVVDALAAYQNEDGGFGHGIEPDIRLGASSPMATSVGLEYAVAVGA